MRKTYKKKCKRCGEVRLRESHHAFVCGFCKNSGYRKPPHWKEIRLKLLATQPYCSFCYRTEDEILLDIDHIDKNRLNNDLDNLRVLCRQCHASKHQNEGKELLEVTFGTVGVRLRWK